MSTTDKLFRVSELSHLLYTLVTLSVGGMLAFGLGFSEFLLVSRTSSLTLSIAGIFKVRIHLKDFLICFYIPLSNIKSCRSSLLLYLNVHFSLALLGFKAFIRLKPFIFFTKTFSLSLSVGGVHSAAGSGVHGG